jgi:hypothetical protein
MKRSLHIAFIFIIFSLFVMSGLTTAQPEETTVERPPIAQPLVREGDFAVKMVNALNLGTVTNETEAESVLGSAGISPRNGWIADYPVTPDIIGELQTSVSEAADAGKISMGKDAALRAVQDVTAGYNLDIKTEAEVPRGSSAPATNYPAAPVVNNYYYDEGPPVVTYYAPPPDYGYMYTWVPYPFWWWSYWYPGYYMLVDFHVGYGYGYGGYPVYISNHYRDIRTGGMVRIDPANRARGGTIPDRGGAGLSRPAARSGAQAILNSTQARPRTGRSTGYRGYGDRPSAGTRSSVYEHSRNIRLERAASERGYLNRSNAGRTMPGSRGGQAVSPGVSRPLGGRGGSAGNAGRGTGGGVSRGDGGGGYSGGGRR